MNHQNLKVSLGYYLIAAQNLYQQKPPAAILRPIKTRRRAQIVDSEFALKQIKR